MRVQFGRGAIDLARGGADGPAALSELETRFLTYMALRAGLPVARADLLKDVWNYHPDVQTRAIDLLVSKTRKKVEACGGEIASIRGFGYRLDGVILVESGPRRATALSPAREPPLVGRADDLEAVLEALVPGAWVAVVGEPGVGKSRLVREVVRTVLAKRSAEDSVWILGATGAPPVDDLWRGLAEAAGVEPIRPFAASGRALLSQAPGRVMLVLDDVHGNGLGAFLEAAAQVRSDLSVLASGWQNPLGSTAHTHRLEPLGPDDVAAILIQRAQARLGRRPPEAALDIWRHRLDGNPAVAELVAGLIPLEMPGQDGDLADRPEVQVGLDRALSGAWSSLSPPARAVLAVACAADAQLDIGLLIDAARQMDPRSGEPEVSSLEAAGLLRPASSGTVRAPLVVRSAVRAQGPSAAATTALLSCLEGAATGAIRPRSRTAREWAARHRDLLRWGIDRALEGRSGSTAATLVLALGIEGHADPMAFLQALLGAAAMDLPRTLRFAVLVQAARIERAMGLPSSCLREAEACADGEDDRARLAFELSEGPLVAGDPQAALQCVEAWTQARDAFTAARIASVQGQAFAMLGRSAAADHALRRALQGMRQVGYDIGVAFVLCQLSEHCEGEGRLLEARELALRAEAEADGHPTSVLHAAMRVAQVDLGRGDTAAVARHIARVGGIVEMALQPRDRLRWRLVEARSLLEQGQVDEAADALVRLKADLWTLPEPVLEGEWTVWAAETALAQDRPQEALDLLSRRPDKVEDATTDALLACIACEAQARLGQVDRARSSLAAIAGPKEGGWVGLHVAVRSVWVADDALGAAAAARSRLEAAGVLPGATPWRALERAVRARVTPSAEAGPQARRPA